MGVLNPSSQLIFSPNPSSQLINLLKSQPNIREFWPIPKSQLISVKQSQVPAIFKGQSQLPANGHQDPHTPVESRALIYCPDPPLSCVLIRHMC